MNERAGAVLSEGPATFAGWGRSFRRGKMTGAWIRKARTLYAHNVLYL